MKILKVSLLLLLLNLLLGCGQIFDRQTPETRLGSSARNRPNYGITAKSQGSKLAEVATPQAIAQLSKESDRYRPQVKIVTPRSEQTFNRTEIEIELKVADLPVFRDDKLNLGNHLHLIVDNEPVREIYDLEQPTIIKDLAPGSHTIRVLAVRPWGESYKTEGAYAQTIFNVLAETNDNRPDPNLPLLTYNLPAKTYGSETFLLDFYLTNAPLHAIAKNNPNLMDWRVKATVDGDSFILPDWQAVYLTGIEPGENWVQLELVDEAGQDIENVFNNTVRVFNYDPQQQDTLAKLMKDELSASQAKAIVEQNYYIQPVTESETLENIEESEESKESQVTESIPETLETTKEIPVVETEKQTTTPIEKSNSDVTSSVDRLKKIGSTPPTIIVPTPETSEALTENTAIESDDLNRPEAIQPEVTIVPSDAEKITLVDEKSDSTEAIAASEIPQAESVEITEDEIAIVIAEPEEVSILEETKPEQASKWWKKILVRVRYKLESLVKLLPSDV